MNESIVALRERFEAVAQEAQTLSFLPRATELQEASCQATGELLEKLQGAKAAAVQRGDDDAANTLLAMELALQTVLEELRMWIDLKRDAAESAWDHLVSAQGACEDAIRVRRQLQAKPPTAGLENVLKRLVWIERMVFPPQVFNSIGGTARWRECSICGRSYDDCSHVKGRAYMGKLCHRILHDVQPEEISIVTHPANKRARITHFSDQGKMRNKLTWRLEEAGAVQPLRKAGSGAPTPKAS